MMLSTCHGELFGQFVMPKSVLVQQGILSKAGQGGKRACGCILLGIRPSVDKHKIRNVRSWANF